MLWIVNFLTEPLNRTKTHFLGIEALAIPNVYDQIFFQENIEDLF